MYIRNRPKVRMRNSVRGNTRILCCYFDVFDGRTGSEGRAVRRVAGMLFLLNMALFLSGLYFFNGALSV